MKLRRRLRRAPGDLTRFRVTTEVVLTPKRALVEECGLQAACEALLNTVEQRLATWSQVHQDLWIEPIVSRDTREGTVEEHGGALLTLRMYEPGHTPEEAGVCAVAHVRGAAVGFGNLQVTELEVTPGPADLRPPRGFDARGYVQQVFDAFPEIRLPKPRRKVV